MRRLGLLLAATGVVGAGTAAGLSVPVVAGSFVGAAVAAGLVGLATPDRPLVETGVAAVVARLGLLAAGPAVGAGPGAGLAALGTLDPAAVVPALAVSFAVGALGAHFGTDLRHGLTTPVESPSATTRAVNPSVAAKEADDSTVAANEADGATDDSVVTPEEPNSAPEEADGATDDSSASDLNVSDSSDRAAESERELE